MNEWFSQKWERALLVFASILAIAVAALLVVKVLSFKDRFEIGHSRPVNELPNPGIAGMGIALGQLDNVELWEPPTVAGMRPSLVKSTFVIQQGGRLIDLNQPDPILRAPIPNQWWLDYGVSSEAMYENALERDPDGDGFSNHAEWIGKSDPTDSDSFPPRTDKLFLVKRDADPYVLEFSSYVAPRYTIRRITKKRKSWSKEQGQEFDPDEKGRNRFKLVRFEEKFEINPATNTKTDASELTILDLRDEQPAERILKYRKRTDLPVYSAVFRYELDGGSEFSVKAGEIFELPNTSEKYKVLVINEDQAVISDVVNPEKQIKISLSQVTPAKDLRDSDPK